MIKNFQYWVATLYCQPDAYHREHEYEYYTLDDGVVVESYEQLCDLVAGNKPIKFYLSSFCREIMGKGVYDYARELRKLGYLIGRIELEYSTCKDMDGVIRFKPFPSYMSAAVNKPVTDKTPLDLQIDLLKFITPRHLVRIENEKVLIYPTARSRTYDQTYLKVCGVVNISAILAAMRYANADDTPETLGDRIIKKPDMLEYDILTRFGTALYLMHGIELFYHLHAEPSAYITGIDTCFRTSMLNLLDVTNLLSKTAFDYMERYPRILRAMLQSPYGVYGALAGRYVFWKYVDGKALRVDDTPYEMGETEYFSKNSR